MKFLRAIRLDPSDQYVYPVAAIPGEWAVPGSFALWDVEPETVSGKAREAFRRGFVGTRSFGWTTLVMTDTIDERELRDVREQLIEHLIKHYGAPDRGAASEVADQEIHFAQELCSHPPGTYVAVERSASDGEIEEQYRTVPSLNNMDHSNLRLFGPKLGSERGK